MVCFFIVFFKQKTAYELRISDWSSDVCSSDLGGGMLLLVAAYLLLCARSHGRTWTFRGTEFSLPSLRMAVGQVGDRKSVVQGKSVSVRVDLVGRRIIK